MILILKQAKKGFLFERLHQVQIYPKIYTLFESENERQKIEPVPLPLPRASRNFPDVKTRNEKKYIIETSKVAFFSYPTLL